MVVREFTSVQGGWLRCEQHAFCGPGRKAHSCGNRQITLAEVSSGLCCAGWLAGWLAGWQWHTGHPDAKGKGRCNRVDWLTGAGRAGLGCHTGRMETHGTRRQGWLGPLIYQAISAGQHICTTTTTRTRGRWASSLLLFHIVH